MKKATIILMFIIICLSSNAQEKKLATIYVDKAEIEFAKKTGTTPLTQSERAGYDLVCEKIKTPLLCILSAKVDEARRLIVYLVKQPDVNYDFLAKYIFTCIENIHPGLKSCMCVDIDTIKELDEYTMTVELLGETKK